MRHGKTDEEKCSFPLDSRAHRCSQSAESPFSRKSHSDSQTQTCHMFDAYASCQATSAVLNQREGDDLFPIAFHSQTLTETQLQHSLLDEEVFALVDFIERYKFSGTNFQVYTDSKVLFYLMEAKESNTKLY